jgi:hypothetical protein
MATYYVRTDGNDSNTGTGAGVGQAWGTITKAIGATGIAPGDTLYIAPGVYRGNFTAAFTNPVNEGQRITIAGDPTCTQFTGVSAGPVILTNYTNATTSSNLTGLTIVKDYISLIDLCFVMSCTGGTAPAGEGVVCTTTALVVNRCLVSNRENATESHGFFITVPSQTSGPTITKSIFIGNMLIANNATSSYNSNGLINDCLFISTSLNSTTVAGALTLGSFSTNRAGGYTVANCTFYSGASCISMWPSFGLSTTHPSLFTNNYFRGAIGINSSSTAAQSETYNIFECVTDRVNANAGTGSVSKPQHALDMHISKIQGWSTLPFLAPLTNSYGINAGNVTSAPSTDMLGVTWLTPSTPTIGSTETSRIANQYQPTERNASTITIAPASTSQSIELYLGATGLTASTSGLSARYNRTRTASVSIPLVARTIAQAWTSGGFAEVDATNMPGVYRLDLPDAALAAGADDVTIVVRGASGTNGAVMTVKLSSGGLTEAQTASAVWGASVAGYSGASTFGGIVTETSSVVNGIDGEVQDIPSNVWEELRANHDTVGTFGQYVNAELVTPVTSAALVRMGPFEVRADGLGASDPLDIQKGAQHGIDIQCVDNNNAGIDITSATVTAKVYNSGATLVDTYSCTATYAADGRATFTIDTTVTNTPGTYTATITRTTGASDTQIFGPLRIYVRDI